MGTNAIPKLVKMLTVNEFRLKRFSTDLLSRQKLIRVDLLSAQERRRRGCLAFEALGTGGRAAIPELIRLLNDDSEDVQQCACFCLGKVAPGDAITVSALTNALTRSRITARLSIETQLGRMQKHAAAAVPALAAQLRTTNIQEFTAVALALLNFSADARVAQPVLLDCLQSPDDRVRTLASNVLSVITAPAEQRMTSRELVD